MEEGMIVTEKIGEVWHVYSKNDPGKFDMDKILSKAVGVVYLKIIGELVLANPEYFGVRIEEKED